MSVAQSSIEDAMVIQAEDSGFSGVVWIQQSDAVLCARAFAYANQAEQISNTIDTRFQMASGSKTFTAVTVCQLVERGCFDFDTLLGDCLDIEFPHFAPKVTVHHLLTHTSGIPDYFDEEWMDDFEALWLKRPCYSMQGPEDFLPMFQSGPMKLSPGKRFSYSNAGFIVLGLLIEKWSGMSFADYVCRNVLERAGMANSGYFAADRLPGRTALSYIVEEDSWRTNIYAVPIVGQPDGGAYTTAPDMARFWDALAEGRLLEPTLVERMLTARALVKNKDNNVCYGYGVWIRKQGDTLERFYALGCDPGVTFISAVFPEKDLLATVIGNSDDAGWAMWRTLEEHISQVG